MNEPEQNDELDQQQTQVFLSKLFGEETLNLAKQLDIADINMNDNMTKSIGSGVSQLKKLKGDVAGQKDYISTLDEGARLLLCLWILDMVLLEKLR